MYGVTKSNMRELCYVFPRKIIVVKPILRRKKISLPSEQQLNYKWKNFPIFKPYLGYTNSEVKSDIRHGHIYISMTSERCTRFIYIVSKFVAHYFYLVISLLFLNI